MSLFFIMILFITIGQIELAFRIYHNVEEGSINVEFEV